MSIDTLAENMMTSMTALTAALTRVADNQERLIAGQAAAIERVEAGKGETAPRKRRTKEEIAADEAAAAAAPEKAAVENPPTTAPTPAAGDTTDEMVKATAVAWMGTTTDPAEKDTRAKWLQTMIGSFGVDDAPMKMLTGPNSKLTADLRKRVVFFIKRANALGMDKVNFDAAYDFDGAKDQPEPTVVSTEAAFDPLG